MAPVGNERSKMPPPGIEVSTERYICRHPETDKVLNVGGAR